MYSLIKTGGGVIELQIHIWEVPGSIIWTEAVCPARCVVIYIRLHRECEPQVLDGGHEAGNYRIFGTEE
jgi:hypothetical protein